MSKLPNDQEYWCLECAIDEGHQFLFKDVPQERECANCGARQYCRLVDVKHKPIKYCSECGQEIA